MDNANKIDSNLTHKEVSLFLGDELKNQNQQGAVTYDLVAEYEKTANNHKPFVWLLLALCFFVVGAGTFVTIAMVSSSNHKISININSFEDLNLRSFLNSAGRAQNSYEDALRNKANLEQNLQFELQQAEQKRDMDLYTLQSIASVIDKNSISDRKIRIELDYNTVIQNIHKEYDAKIAAAEKEVSKYQSQIASYDSEKLSQAQKAESSIDSTKQLHDMQMRSQSDGYELKIRNLQAQLAEQQKKAAEEQRNAVEQVRSIYQAKIDLLDPKAREQSNEQDKIIFDAGIKNQTEDMALWNSVDSLTFDDTEYTKKAGTSPQTFSESLKKTQKELNELKIIASRFKPIPMENSIKDYVPAMLHQSYQIANDLAERESKLQGDLNAFSLIAEQSLLNGVDGIILNTAQAPVFSVYLSRLALSKISQADSIPVQILNGSRAVATGTLSNVNGEFFVTQDILEGTPPAQRYNPVSGDRIRIVTAR